MYFAAFGDCVGVRGDVAVSIIIRRIGHQATAVTKRTESRPNLIIVVISGLGVAKRWWQRRKQGYRHLIFMNEFLFDDDHSNHGEQKQQQSRFVQKVPNQFPVASVVFMLEWVGKVVRSKQQPRSFEKEINFKYLHFVYVLSAHLIRPNENNSTASLSIVPFSGQ